MTARRWALAAVASVGLMGAACSSGSHTTTPTVPTTVHHGPPSTASTSTTAAAQSTTSTTAASAACNQMTASAGPSQGAAGTITGVVTVTNTGPSPCTANGYPTVALFSGSGAPLTVTMVDGLSVTVSPASADAPPAAVALAPSSSAQFAYQYSDVPVAPETSCPASETARVTMPGATMPSANFAFAISPCNSGTVRVSPVYSGS